MPDLSAKKANYVSREVAAAKRLIDAVNDLMLLQQEYENNGYASGAPNAITDDDCVGSNAHMDAALVANVLTSAQAVAGFMVSNYHDDVIAQAIG